MVMSAILFDFASVALAAGCWGAAGLGGAMKYLTWGSMNTACDECYCWIRQSPISLLLITDDNIFFMFNIYIIILITMNF